MFHDATSTTGAVSRPRVLAITTISAVLSVLTTTATPPAAAHPVAIAATGPLADYRAVVTASLQTVQRQGGVVAACDGRRLSFTASGDVSIARLRQDGSAGADEARQIDGVGYARSAPSRLGSRVLTTVARRTGVRIRWIQQLNGVVDGSTPVDLMTAGTLSSPSTPVATRTAQGFRVVVEEPTPFDSVVTTADITVRSGVITAVRSSSFDDDGQESTRNCRLAYRAVQVQRPSGVLTTRMQRKYGLTVSGVEVTVDPVLDVVRRLAAATDAEVDLRQRGGVSQRPSAIGPNVIRDLDLRGWSVTTRTRAGEFTITYRHRASGLLLRWQASSRDMRRRTTRPVAAVVTVGGRPVDPVVAASFTTARVWDAVSSTEVLPPGFVNATGILRIRDGSGLLRLPAGQRASLTYSARGIACLLVVAGRGRASLSGIIGPANASSVPVEGRRASCPRGSVTPPDVPND